MEPEIRRIAIELINPAPYNPRLDLQPEDVEYQQLFNSFKNFGNVELLVWNELTGNLVGGHQRLKILKALGVKEVMVAVVKLSLEQEKALNLALNKVTGSWDQQKLAQLLDELTKVPDFDIEQTGFKLQEAEELIADVLHCSDEDEAFDIDANLDRDHPAITKKGEVIELGRHRLLCGDSGDSLHVDKLLDGTMVDLLFTDPPYNVSYYGGDRPIPEKARPKQSRQWERIYGDDKTQEEYTAWLSGVLANVTEHMSPGACFYIWNGHRQFGPMHSMLEAEGFKVSCVITWAKESFAIGYGDYNQQTEFCLYGWREAKGGHKWYGPTNESTLWQVNRDPTHAYHHPTQKPLELAERAIRNSTRAADSVLDVFLGSGTTLLAAERTGRRCFGLEIDPHYCDVVIRRWINFVGTANAPGALVQRYTLNKEVAS